MAIRACVVECPLNAPNSLRSRLPAIFGSSRLPSVASNNFLRAGVSEIGLRSSWIECGAWDFGIGTTFALFQRSTVAAGQIANGPASSPAYLRRQNANLALRPGPRPSPPAGPRIARRAAQPVNVG
jgi:hypothetical protein